MSSLMSSRTGQPRIRCIDVFSGIGGISLALHDVVETVQYCEINQFCTDILEARMADGRLDRAPIHDDIRTLRSDCSPAAPEMIMGGFPCQDISTLGQQRGIADGERSSLFNEIMRIVDECPTIRVIFLENVQNIIKCGMKEVVTECVQRGFSLQWLVRSAGEMGAPHVRNRWFCLGVRSGYAFDASTLQRLAAPSSSSTNPWADEPKDRVRPRPPADGSSSDHWMKRCAALGNSVVPCVVRSAFAELAQASRYSNDLATALRMYRRPALSLTYPYPETGLIHQGMFYAVPAQHVPPVQHKVSITVQLDGQTRRLPNLPTPRHGLTHASSLTDRAVHDLPTVMVYCEETRQRLPPSEAEEQPLHQRLIPDVNYIEWMMGYSKDWTSPNKGLASPNGEPKAPKECRETPAKSARRCNVSGLNLYHRDHPNVNIKTITTLWNELPPETKEEYRGRAKQLRESSNA